MEGRLRNIIVIILVFISLLILIYKIIPIPNIFATKRLSIFKEYEYTSGVFPNYYGPKIKEKVFNFFQHPGIISVSNEPQLSATLSLNNSLFTQGDEMVLKGMIGGRDEVVDIFFGIEIAPGARFFLTSKGWSPEPEPLIQSWKVIPVEGELFRFQFSGLETKGEYAWFIVFAKPNSSFMDRRNWISDHRIEFFIGEKVLEPPRKPGRESFDIEVENIRVEVDGREVPIEKLPAQGRLEQIPTEDPNIIRAFYSSFEVNIILALVGERIVPAISIRIIEDTPEATDLINLATGEGRLSFMVEVTSPLIEEVIGKPLRFPVTEELSGFGRGPFIGTKILVNLREISLELSRFLNIGVILISADQKKKCPCKLIIEPNPAVARWHKDAAKVRPVQFTAKCECVKSPDCECPDCKAGKVTWTFTPPASGDGNSASGDSNTGKFTPNHNFNLQQPVTWTVKATSEFCGDATATVIVAPPDFVGGEDYPTRERPHVPRGRCDQSGCHSGSSPPRGLTIPPAKAEKLQPWW